MNITADRTTLLTALQLVAPAAAQRSPMPVYQNVKAVAAAGRLTLLATDLDVGVRHTTAVQTDEPGVAVWPVGRLIAILRESNGEDVRIDTDGRRTHVTTNGSDYELPVEDPASFADFGAGEPGPVWEVAAGDLARALARTAFAAARDEGKYALRGVLFQLDGKTLTVVGTDGKRLAVGHLPAVPRDGAAAVSGVVSPKAVQLIGKTLTGPEVPVSIDLRANEMTVAVGPSLVYSRLVEGRFPPYQAVIPKKFNARVALGREAFLSAVRQAAVMTDDESKRINFAFRPGAVTLAAQGATTGKSKVVHPLDGYEGPAVDIAFDPAYLTEFLRAVGEESVGLELVDGQKSAVFRAGADYLYLVVPLV